MKELEELAGWVELEGCYNFRDLGGYKTAGGRKMRTGQVFRSDGLQHLSERDLAKLRDEIGLGTVIDLRSPQEVEEAGCGAIADYATIVPLPLFQQTRSQAVESTSGEAPKFEMPPNMGELYFFMLTFAKDPIVGVVRELANSEAPAVFHCAAGKDRTGVISALLLSLLEVPHETIVADYAFSRQNIDQINARLNASDSYQRFMDELPDGAYDADPAAMEHFLGKVSAEHGSMVDWARTAGIDDEVHTRLADKLLE